MNHVNDQTLHLQHAVQQALEQKTPLEIRGGGSKSFLGRRERPQQILQTSAHTGVVIYEPTELAITVRSGTTLREVEELLQQQQQQLPFEPPAFSTHTTLGGIVAAGLSGPRRPYAGAVRDAVLGVKLINGKGEIVEYGGRVMKNVAGYDVSRLMTGAMGTLGVLLEISFKLQPQPQKSRTLSHELPLSKALAKMTEWTRETNPIDATVWHEGQLYFRLSGSAEGVDAARKKLGGEKINQPHQFWQKITHHQQRFFLHNKPLWRLSLPANTADLDLEGQQLVEWNGCQRWLLTNENENELRKIVMRHGGHATLFRGNPDCENPYHPLSSTLFRLHQNLKQAFDPHSIFNPGRLYAGL
jgi:glycolate oxidase FAD binding subunit